MFALISYLPSNTDDGANYGSDLKMAILENEEKLIEAIAEIDSENCHSDHVEVYNHTIIEHGEVLHDEITDGHEDQIASVWATRILDRAADITNAVIEQRAAEKLAEEDKKREQSKADRHAEFLKLKEEFEPATDTRLE